MDNKTRLLFNQYCDQISNLNGGVDPSKKFDVAPAVEQKLESRIQQSTAFLTLINSVGVKHQSGEKIGIGFTGTLAKRTDTNSEQRRPQNLSGSDGLEYHCRQTDYDIALKYKLIDQWRHRPEFQTLLRDSVINQQGLDRLMIGFNGTHVAATTDRVAYPLLQDLNIGWLQNIRNEAPAQHDAAGIKIGADIADMPADYRNLDAAVLEAKELLHEVYRDAADLVVIASRSMVSDKYLKLTNSSDAPTERIAVAKLIGNKELAGLPAITPAYFPDRAFLITPLSNLSHYWQEGTRRRHIEDEPKRDQISDYNSLNEDFVVERYEACALVENIQQHNADSTAWE